MILKSRGKWSPEDIRAAMYLYAVTDRQWLNGRTLASCVEDTLAAGTTCIQLRDKNSSTAGLILNAKALEEICGKYEVPLIINDDVDAALKAKADGVHIGQKDMSCAKAREILGEDFIIGVSVKSVDEAIKAQEESADYLGVGAMKSTDTKPDADLVELVTLEQICRTVEIPVVAIGGITAENLGLYMSAGAAGVAVCSAIFDSDDIVASTQALLTALSETIGIQEKD
ncbi:MAG: thiamine phosphate synthase [Eggerthellaceae bacterium]|nr:thiamine phosphate synthase [Eggerthellaceae bacterium]